MRLLLDVTRTLLRFHNATPTGIDRVELAYATRLLETDSPYELHFVILTPLGPCTIARPRMLDMLKDVAARWQSANTSSSGIHIALNEYLDGALDLSRRLPVRFGANERDPWSIWPRFGLLKYFHQGRNDLARLVRESGTTTTFYLHVSHLGLETEKNFEWLRGSKIRPLFLIHDLIPIDFPEFCGDAAERKHHQRLRTAATFGAALIAHSAYTKSRIEALFANGAIKPPPTVISWLGTEADPVTIIDLPTRAPSVPYFIHVGTIEGRKNINHLLNVWRRMLETTDRAKVPRLVIAGRRGWKCQVVFDTLDKSHELAAHVAEVNDLDDAQMVSLVRRSAGMLCPSIVEGFGLPAAEALTLGVPVIASDIPAYREILGEAAEIVDWTDGPGWSAAIQKLTNDADYREQQIAATKKFAPISWATHVDKALEKATAAAISQENGANH